VNAHAPRTVGAEAAPSYEGMRVLHVVRQFRPNRGGLEDVVANLCLQQIACGANVRVVTLNRLFSSPDSILPAEEMIDGIAVTRIPFWGSKKYPLAPAVFMQIADADIIHVHGIDFFFDALALTNLLRSQPLVATTHGGFFHTQDLSWLKQAWFLGPTRISSRLCDAIVGCSASDAASFARLAPSKVSTVENGVDLAKFGAASSQVPVKHLVSLGRFSKNKRPERLIATMAALTADDPDWHLDLIGVASDWSVEALKAEIAGKGLSEKISLHTGLDDKAAASLMGRSSFFVSASEYEGFGVALIEAMSAGLVPIVQPNEAFRDLVQRHPKIQLTDFANARQAASAIAGAYQALISAGNDIRPMLSELARYAWPRVAQQYLAVYRAAYQRKLHQI
jgi:alpha-1,3-mannosyltransferase